MARARRAHSPQASQPLYEDETDLGSEPETPKKHKQNLKKRLSEAYNPETDTSFASDSARHPLRSVNINDDAAEKRRRRKSTKITVIENAMAGPSSENATDPDAETSRTAKQKYQLKSVAPPPIINVPKDVMSSNFEEWMKMATDNKINATNSWNFALIDYFHDMSLLRNNDDNSINFQRASYTLDGCVKIWTSRVDSVGTETGRLLSNLASDGRDEDGDENNSDNPDGDPSQSKKKKQNRSAVTLAKDPSQLRSKKLDLEFSVDPLFKKTCADFDEGGAQGLLMNHLSLGMGSDGGLRVVFDASDSMGRVEEDKAAYEPEDEIDLSYLRKEFLPNLGALEDKAISHSLAEFAFAKDAFTFDETTFFQDNTRNGDEDDNEIDIGDGFTMDIDGGAPAAEDFFAGVNTVNDDYSSGDVGGDDYGGDNGSNGSVGPPGETEGHPPGLFVPFDPRRAPNERDLIMAMTDADGDEGMMDYFDQNFLKNWAGPEHWKLRKVIRRPETAPNNADKLKPRREKKEAFKIDFLTPPDPEKSLKEIANELFAPVIKGAGINLPGTGTTAKKSKKKTKEKRDDHRLPDDMHFSSKQLVTLFLKPKFFLKMRGQRVKMNENGDGEVDENFWAQAAAGQPGRGGEGDDTMDGGPVPFNTQFFHDDYDDGPGFDDVDPYDGDGIGVPDADAGEQDLLAATQGQTRRVRPEFVNYAKRAKRVDVRKLKDNIWRGLEIIVAPTKKGDEEDENMDVDEDLPPPTDPTEARVFSQVISGLQRSYPQDKMEEISTSFCFICLLHLANEQGLKLESTVDMPVQREEVDEKDISADKKIGNIWDLKIYRDPNATQSA
ncbi:condensin complex subunit 2/barren [Collybia nuda]|uniref:Condensin complex subunit 2 n=1 Tax=Collybia nuda TaxID=64659 RepID=A0A9P6CJK1_9AGAR|nr:condensin complex subunit 2/barren [Collybia nuda]